MVIGYSCSIYPTYNQTLLYGERCISRRVTQIFVENALSKGIIDE